ncbi:hypothetical protein LCGC14_1735940, partial [marine sediment metagenome]
MIRHRNIFVAALAAVLVVASPAMAQSAAGPASAPATQPLGPKVPASALLARIPAGCMGFVIVNNINDLGTKVDAFIKSISPEGQPMLPMSVVQLLQAQAELGQGLNLNAPVAAVMLDPKQYGLDLETMIGDGPVGEDGAEPPKVPVLLILPTNDVSKLMAAHNPVKDGLYIKTNGSVYWQQRGNFAVGSPNKKALANSAVVTKSILKQLSPADRAMVARNDVAAWVDFKIVGPLALAGMDKFSAMMAKQDPIGGGQFKQVMDMYKEPLKQIQDLGLGLRFAKTGILVESRLSFLPDSLIGKALAMAKPVKGSPLNRLPNMPYAIAMGFRGLETMPMDLNMQMLDKLFAADMFKGLSAEDKVKWKAMAEKMQGQATGVQLAIGGTAGNEGVLGLAYVIECKSAAALRGMLPEYLKLVSKLYKAMGDENLAKVEFKYAKGVETVGGTQVDVLSIGGIAVLDDMGEDDRAKLKAVLG